MRELKILGLFGLDKALAQDESLGSCALLVLHMRRDCCKVGAIISQQVQLEEAPDTRVQDGRDMKAIRPIRRYFTLFDSDVNRENQSTTYRILPHPLVDRGHS